MAATILTISKIGDPLTSIEVKVNDGHPVPTTIVTESIQSFRTWLGDNGHMFIWTNAAGQERSMKVPATSIGWIVASRPINVEGDRFRIDAPCSVEIVVEV